MYETVLYRCSAKFDVSSEHITQVLSAEAESIGMEFDKEELQAVENTLPGRIAGKKHDIHIRPGEGFYLVTEELSVSLRWHLLFILPISVLSLMILNLRFEFYTGNPYIQAAVILATIAVFFIWMYISPHRVVLLNRASSENFNRQREYSYLEASIVLLGIVFILLGISAQLQAGTFTVYFFTAMLSVGVVAHLASVFTDRLLSGQFLIPELDTRLPTFTLKLGLVKVMSIVGGLSVILHGTVIGPALRPLSTSFYVFTTVIVLGISSIILLVLLLFVRDLGPPSYHDFLEFRESSKSRSLKIFSTLILILISYFLLFTGYQVFELVFLTSSTPLLIRVAGLPVLAAIVYFPAGIVYQTGSYISNVWDIVSRSEQVDLEFNTDHVVRTISFDGEESVYFAAGLNTGLNQYIIVSDDLLSDFDMGELKAVVYHEEAHINFGDTDRALIVVVTSLLTGLGRNLFFPQLDFHDREFQADEFAAEKIGSEPVISALRKIQENSLQRTRGITGLGISPFGGELNRPEGPEKYFDLFFGDYTIREAHPSVEDRIERIERLQSLEGYTLMRQD